MSGFLGFELSGEVAGKRRGGGRHFTEAAVPEGECGPCPVFWVIPWHSPGNQPIKGVNRGGDLRLAQVEVQESKVCVGEG